MLKRNLTSILLIIAMLLNVLNHDFSSDIKSMNFLLFIGSTLMILVGIILIFRDESKRKNES